VVESEELDKQTIEQHQQMFSIDDDDDYDDEEVKQAQPALLQDIVQ
jgi:hypothetical protein